jgi:O-antigen ligase
VPGRIASWLLMACVALAPLPFGSNEPTAVAFWCIVLGLCLVLAPVPTLKRGQLALAAVAGVVVAAYALGLHEELAEHPWLAAANPVWRNAQGALGTPLQPSVSIVRNQPWFELGKPLACVLAIACGFLIGADAERARRLMKVIGWSGVAYATYGILAYLFDPTHILGLEKKSYLTSVTGTFINRNTAAAYFGSCAVVWALLLFERVRLEIGQQLLDWRVLIRRLAMAVSKKGVALRAVMFLLCLAAMFMTGSRAGVVLSLLALILSFGTYFRRDMPWRFGSAITAAGGAAVALLLLTFMGGSVNTRFDLEGLATEGRFEVYRSTLRMIADHPWFGTGLGTFASAFPAYRSPNASVWGVWDMAHNTLLEIAADMGLPIAALVVVGWLIIFVVLIRGVLVRRRDLIVPIAALCVALLAVLHSLVDFTLQIPGYAIVAMSLIGAGLVQAFPSGTRRADKADTPQADTATSGLANSAAQPYSKRWLRSLQAREEIISRSNLQE